MRTKMLFIGIFLFFSAISTPCYSQKVSKLDTITDTNVDPYKYICHQSIHRDRLLGDRYFQSTGFLIARNVVLTAAHNLYSVTGSRVDKITIHPGRYKDTYSYDSVTISGLTNCKNTTRVNPRFKFGKVSYDFAIIIIPENLLVNKNWPSASSFELDPSYVLNNGEKINVAGFPASGGYDGSIMTYQNQEAEAVNQTTIPHNLDTQTGNSGSPIWVEKNGKKIVVGVHTYAELATKLTTDAITMINNWIISAK